ncbi:MAG TPA: DUF1175 family protein [Candidatus Limnocylindrales bacterium]|nr:DUF1175 family protein [Candidatus Limnocylindrales bacterium]
MTSFAGTGTPAAISPSPYLHLDSPADRDAFRSWFTAIAEYQSLRDANDLPAEINDCAALLRYSYRGALHAHTAEWLVQNKLEALGSLPSVGKYAYPRTPLGAGIFRITPPESGREDKADYAEFADAKTLWRFNTFLVSRDVRVARPGDLLFYRQLEQNSYHSMIYLGRSRLAHAGAEGAIVVYHTGPLGKSRGEMRRVALDELMQHPSPRWRPVPGNSNFLGVYRWNILSEVQ